MKKTVLLVDDSMFMRSLLKNIITTHDFEVIPEASNGEEAILQYNIYKPDLVNLDITMPKINGPTALKTIKKTRRVASLKGEDRGVVALMRSEFMDINSD